VTAYFLESSALVKLYVEEAGSAWLRGHVGSGANELTAAEIAMVEVAAALYRRVRGGRLSPTEAQRGVAQLLSDAADFTLVALDQSILDRALQLAGRHALRGYDCVQLGTALAIEDRRRAAGLDSLVLVSADGDLNAAAAAEGLPVEDPNAR
jgi:predicted nucleic acid-binding protein